MGYARAEFRLKKGTTIAVYEKLQLTDNYTSLSSTSSQTIFTGIIEDYSLTDIKDITAVSQQDEIERIQPVGYFQGLTTVYLDRMIAIYGDFLSTSYSTNTWTGYYNSSYNFASQTGRTNTDIDWVSKTIELQNCDIQPVIGTHNNVLRWRGNTNWLIGHQLVHDYPANPTYGTVEFAYRSTDTAEAVNIRMQGKQEVNSITFMLDNDEVQVTGSNIPIADDTWYYIRIDFRCNGADAYSSLSENTYRISVFDSGGSHLTNSPSIENFNVNADWLIDLRFIQTNEVLLSHNLYIDAIGTYPYSEFGEDMGYTLGDNQSAITYNLPVTTEITYKELTGGETLQSIFTEGAMREEETWALAPDGDVRWTDGTSATGITLDGTQEVWDVTARVQTKKINRVVLNGPAIQSIKNNLTDQASAGQVIIYKDYRADVDNQDDLDTLAQSILDVQGVPPLEVSLSLRWAAKGWIQIGETIHINADSIQYNESSSYIPVGDYRVVSETLYYKDGTYDYVDLVLQDGLQYTKQLDSDKIDQNTQNANRAYGGTVVSGSSGSGIGAVVEDSSPQLGGDLDLNSYEIDFPTTSIDDVIDDDSMATADDKNLATAESIKAYHDNVNNLPAHVLATTGPHTGSLPWSDLNKTGSSLADLATRQHSNLSDAPIDAHHARDHNIDGSTHTLSGGTDGHALRATSATTFAFEEIVSDLEYDGTAWNGITDIAPSKNAVRDVIDPLTSAVKYSGVWTAGTDKYPEAQVDDVDGSTNSASPTIFTDSDADFSTAGVLINDILNIREGTDLGFYVITAVGTTTVTCGAASFSTASSLEYQIFRAVGGEYWICDADGEYDDVWYEVGDWLIWNDTEIQWDRIRNSFGDNVISVAPGDNIQNAIDEVESIGDGVIVLLPGTHNLTASLTINDGAGTMDIIIRGSGDTTVIDSGDRTTLTITQCKTCVLENFKIDCSDITTSTTKVIDVDETNNNKIILRGLTIIGHSTNKNGYGIHIDSSWVTIEKCYIEYTYYGVIIGQNGNQIEVRDSIIKNTNNRAITTYTSHGVGHDLRFYDNYIADAGSFGITITGSVYRIIVQGNKIVSCDSHGISVGGNYCSIVGNYLQQNTTIGISVDGDYNIADGNYLYGETTGINVSGDYNYIGINGFYNCTTDISDSGIGTIILGDDTAYNTTSWDGNFGTPTKNAVRDELVSHYGSSSTDHDNRYYTETEINNFNFLQEYSGTYTGNDASSRFIDLNCVNEPILVIIYRNYAADDNNDDFWIVIKDAPTNIFHLADTSGFRTRCYTAADGFYVGDGGSNQTPNTNGVTYRYIALCIK